MIELILNKDIILTIKEFLEELEEQKVKIQPKIKEEYDHIFNADNMGLI